MMLLLLFIKNMQRTPLTKQFYSELFATTLAVGQQLNMSSELCLLCTNTHLTSHLKLLQKTNPRASKVKMQVES